MNFSGISTILPVHVSDRDGIAKLRRAMESVLGQECVIPLELILIDDGSPLSPCEELAHLCRHPAVRQIRLSTNRGLVYALNVGLTRARYDLIARIDADDSWRPAKLKKQLRAFAADPDLTLIGTAMRLVHGDRAKDRDVVRGPRWSDALEFFAASACPFPHGSVLARKDIFFLLGGYPHAARFRHCEDFALWGSWIRFFKCEMLDEVLFDYSISEHQISSRYSLEQRDAASVVQRIFTDLGNYARIPEAIAEIAAYIEKPQIETGKMLFTAWRYYDQVLADPEILASVRDVLPDRRVLTEKDLWESTADRFYRINRQRAR